MLSLWLDFGAKAYEWEKGITLCKIFKAGKTNNISISIHFTEKITLIKQL